MDLFAAYWDSHRNYSLKFSITFTHMLQTNPSLWNLGSFPFVRAGRPDHCPTSQVDNEIGLFQEFLLKYHVLGTYYLGCDWSGWRVLIKREIIIATGKVGPVSSDKWKAPQGVAEFALFEGWDSRV